MKTKKLGHRSSNSCYSAITNANQVDYLTTKNMKNASTHDLPLTFSTMMPGSARVPWDDSCDVHQEPPSCGLVDFANVDVECHPVAVGRIQLTRRRTTLSAEESLEKTLRHECAFLYAWKLSSLSFSKLGFSANSACQQMRSWQYGLVVGSTVLLLRKLSERSCTPSLRSRIAQSRQFEGFGASHRSVAVVVKIR